MTAKSADCSVIEFAKTCHKIPALLSYRTRCGKPTCHCATGLGHGPYWYLRWRGRNGTHHHRYVRAGALDEVRQILTKRRIECQAARRAAFAARLWLRSNSRILREMLHDLDNGL
jgi:hypothetical protein